MSAQDTTLSTEQWTALVELFERAVASNAEERRRLVESTLAEDPIVGRELAAMLAAHGQWEGRTDDACGDWRQQIDQGSALAKGESIGPYRILGILGEGGMGVVYRAERADGEVALTTAIKVLRPGTLDAMARERFKRERDLLAGLNHPHIARLFDAGVSAKGQPYFVMEYVRGTTIVTYCDTHRLDIRARLRLFLDVADAVKHAHNQRVLHRDIKPSNVLVDESGVAKLIDFGIAKPLALNGEHIAATTTAERFFSPLNVAPEQLRGSSMGVACDVYQLGTLLYELLCGRTILDLEGKTPSAVEEAISQQIPVAPSGRLQAESTAIAQARGCTDVPALARQLSGDLDEIVLMALRKEPTRRYASVAQLMEDIERHLQVRPVLARGSHRSYRIGRFIRRHWRGLGVAVAALLAAATIDIQSRQLQSDRDRGGAESNQAVDITALIQARPPASNRNAGGGADSPRSDQGPPGPIVTLPKDFPADLHLPATCTLTHVDQHTDIRVRTDAPMARVSSEYDAAMRAAGWNEEATDRQSGGSGRTVFAKGSRRETVAFRNALPQGTEVDITDEPNSLWGAGVTLSGDLQADVPLPASAPIFLGGDQTTRFQLQSAESMDALMTEYKSAMTSAGWELQSQSKSPGGVDGSLNFSKGERGVELVLIPQRDGTTSFSLSYHLHRGGR